MKTKTPKPFSPPIKLCDMCGTRAFWAKVSLSGSLLLLERDPIPSGSYLVLRVEKKTPIVGWTNPALPDASQSRYVPHFDRCPGPR